MNDEAIFAKCAWRLIPFMVVLYVVNFLDRVNVGFAALTMNRDLGFSPAIFGLGAGLFFVGYFLCQIPANLILKRLGARRWIFIISSPVGFLDSLSAQTTTPAHVTTPPKGLKRGLLHRWPQALPRGTARSNRSGRQTAAVATGPTVVTSRSRTIRASSGCCTCSRRSGRRPRGLR